ncbi:MAG: hypothetical protein LAP86_12605 [Acidobacteriia bacterium]|nr:hypothetical protein [Terriglobia bacterium]
MRGQRLLALSLQELPELSSSQIAARNHVGFKETLSEIGCIGKVTYFRLYDLRSTYATRLSAGGVADEWVTQMLRQGDAQVFKKYSQMKLQMKREALEKLNRHANEMPAQKAGASAEKAGAHSGTVTVQ